MRTSSSTLLVTALLLAGRLSVAAQSYQVSWFTIDGGGGTGTGGVYSVSGTIGQPDAGVMSGGSYTVSGGFWAGAIAVQTPGAPLLSIERVGNNVRVFWPLPATDFVLDQAAVLTGSPTNGWSQVAFPYATNATQISVTVPMPAGNRYYRLRKP